MRDESKSPASHEGWWRATNTALAGTAVCIESPLPLLSLVFMNTGYEHRWCVCGKHQLFFLVVYLDQMKTSKGGALGRGAW